MFRGYSYLFEILGILEILRLAALAQNDGVALLVTLGVVEGSLLDSSTRCARSE